MKDMSSFYFFNICHVEIILTSFFTIPLHGIGQGLSDAIISSYKHIVTLDPHTRN